MKLLKFFNIKNIILKIWNFHKILSKKNQTQLNCKKLKIKASGLLVEINKTFIFWKSRNRFYLLYINGKCWKDFFKYVKEYSCLTEGFDNDILDTENYNLIIELIKFYNYFLILLTLKKKNDELIKHSNFIYIICSNKNYINTKIFQERLSEKILK